MKNLPKSLAALLIVCWTVPFCGCGGTDRPAVVKASGTVTIDGKPVETGYIQFIPDKARAATGKIGPDGKFVLGTFDEIDGVVPGKHKVTVISVEDINATSRRWNVPQEYSDPTTSTVEMTVDKPSDALEVKLTSGGKKPVIERMAKEF